MAVNDRRYNEEDNMAELNFAVTSDLTPIQNMTVASNAADVLATVRELVAPYKNLVVTPETRREAKNDLARLRRLRTNIDEQRKAVDKVFAAPAKLFKGQCVDPIIREIDDAIGPIDAQVKAQEEAERQERMDALRAFFEANNTGAAAGYAEWDKIAARHPEWKNKSCSDTQAQNAILLEIANVERGIKALSGPGYEEKYRVPMIDKFLEKYDLSEATMLYTTLKQREAEEAARQQREAERARAEAERKLREAEEARQRRQIAAETTQALNREFTRAETETPTAAEDGGDAPVQTAPAVKRVEFWVEVTREQSKALGRFLRENGIRYGAIGREG